jgi:NAD(P)-dependent dehydrogenase (short-subunit alcohol dehydrogenase family)
MGVIFITKLKGQVAIVIGVSHNQGIGAAICRKLAADGADIFFTHRNSMGEFEDLMSEFRYLMSEFADSMGESHFR